MKERPILFSAPMVRALLDGSKTQTRRVVKPQPPAHMNIVRHLGDGDWQFVNDVHTLADSASTWRCPYGQPGDRLWVKETWAETDTPDGTPVVSYKAGGCIAVGREDVDAPDYLIHAFAWPDAPEPDRWRPSIHMPRWASRITLEITGVRVERLQDISEADAIAEGIDPKQENKTLLSIGTKTISGPVAEYSALWESINGPGSWNANPLVWVIEFKQVTA